MKALTALLLLVAGCIGAPSVVPVAEALPSAEPPPYCVWDIAAPEALDGSLSYATQRPGIDCVTPEGGEVFSVGFATRGWWFQLDALRSAIIVGKSQPLDRTAASLLLVTDDGRSCWEWNGDVTVLADRDAGKAWSVFVDAACADGSGLRLAGQWSSATAQ